MYLHVSSLGTLVPERLCCVFYATKLQVRWGLTHLVFRWYFGLISHNTDATQGLIDWQTHISIYWYVLLWSHSGYLYYIEWIIQWYKKFSFGTVFYFRNYSLVEVTYPLIRCNKTRFFVWNTDNTDRNGKRKITLERICCYENKWYPLF